VRGREPEYSLLARQHEILVIGHHRGAKMIESGVDPVSGVNFVFPGLKRVIAFDPVFVFRHRYECSSWVVFNGLKKILSDVDVIVTHELWPFFSAQSVRIAKSLGIPSAVIVFETIPRNFIFTYLLPYALNTKRVVAEANLFLPQTRRAKSYLGSCGVPETKLRIVYPGIDLDLFKPASRVQDKNEIVVLFVGNFLQKGLPDLLEAFSKLARECPNVVLWIVGDGPPDILAKVTILQRIHNIRYFGKVQHRALADIYRQADIYCQPGRDVMRFGIKTGEEQFSYSLVEAMASGLPIVTTDCGATREVVGKDNIVLQQQNVDGLTTALRTLVRDQELRKEIGASNRKRAEQLFNREIQAKRFLDQICSLTSLR